MSVFNTHLAFALDEILPMPVFDDDDPRALDTPRCATVEGREDGVLKLTLMSSEGMGKLAEESDLVIKLLARRNVQLHDALHLSSLTFLAASCRKGPAPYADHLKLAFRFELHALPAAA